MSLEPQGDCVMTSLQLVLKLFGLELTSLSHAVSTNSGYLHWQGKV